MSGTGSGQRNTLNRERADFVRTGLGSALRSSISRSNVVTSASGEPHSDAYRVAIVGCGPRGLYCLDAICRELEQQSMREKPANFVQTPSHRTLHITIFEPCAHPGAGNVYALNQPRFLRMNFATQRIDAWIDDDFRAADQLNLADWLSEKHPSYADPEGYAPRPVVGEYLHECFQRVLRRLSPLATVTLRRERITTIWPSGDGWKVQFGSGSLPADHVVLTVGHEGWRESECSLVENADVVSGNSLALSKSRQTLNRTEPAASALPLTSARGGGGNRFYIGSVFPVERQLTTDRVPAGASVAVRGFGLTWIDAALSMTEGRGGQFYPTPDGFRYVTAGDEPRVLYPFSRSGRPMLAKPIRSLMSLPPQLDDIWAAGRERLLSTKVQNPKRERGNDAYPSANAHSRFATRDVSRRIDETNFHERIWQPVLDTAQRALDATNAHNATRSSDATVADWYRDWSNNAFTPDRSLREMRRSIAVARGQHVPTHAWALAEAWRHLYPTLVTIVSHGGLSDEAWEDFQPIAAEMERIAYGPPAENQARIVALIDAGIVDLSHIADSDADWMQREKIDVVVNAVLPSPTNPAPNGPIAELLDAGQLRRLNRSTGIDVDRAGHPQTHDCDPHGTLAVFGRSTEGCVLGNDSLSRRIHPHIENWAAQVAATITVKS